MFKILGIEKVDYTSRRTNNRVQGTNLHVENMDPNRNLVSGIQVERIYVKQGIDCSGLMVDDQIEVYYNKFGNVEDVRVVS